MRFSPAAVVVFLTISQMISIQSAPAQPGPGPGGPPPSFEEQDSDVLWLCRATPRRWLAPGRGRPAGFSLGRHGSRLDQLGPIVTETVEQAVDLCRASLSAWRERAIVVDVWAEKGAAYNAFPHPQQIVPPGIPPAHAAAMITLKETLSCLENSDAGPGQSLAVVGTGPVAQSLVLFAKLAGIAPVVVFGRRERWAEIVLHKVQGTY